MSKYNKDNINTNTIMEGKESKPCIVCGDSTQYIDYVYECRVCSEECEEILTRDIMNTV